MCRLRRAVPVAALAVAGPWPGGAAASSDAQAWDAKFQATYVWQRKAAFEAPYSGRNSLSPAREKSYSFTATAAFGVRAWRGGELYFNPEVAQGVPLSGLVGLGGFSNGEIARTAGAHPTLYRARMFLRQTWGFGGERETVESEANQLGGSVDRRRLVVTAGNLSVLDLFDDNAYSHDARTQFLNWSLLTHGAYDFAADARGYSTGIALEYFHDAWALRFGRFTQPREPNGLPLDHRLLQHYGDQVELEHAHTLGGQPGRLRLLVYRNVARMARFADALDFAAVNGGVPDLGRVRAGRQARRGIGINLEQAVTPALGVFARAMRSDGRTETYAFTEIDTSASAGAVLRGRAWGRAQDAVGVALARNGLSNDRRNYLAAGGLGFFIGDGRLNYRPETLVEAYYSLGVSRHLWLSFDWQHIRNPAYNADRGPVNIGTVRLHAAF
ncbi:MAG: carbohydrate porin [Burkholderiales bacterium]|nr:carbohydrate porin [Burkholderiales bacterium]